MTKIISLKTRTTALLQVSAPLMITFLSTFIMVFVNRIFLANYSMNALSATVSAGTLAFGITFGIQTLTLIASIFVAQLNGAGKYQELGKPVWQMIWFSLFSIVIVIPIVFLVKHVLFKNSPIATEQVLVFQCTMWITPLFALLGSLESFYNGQGKTLVVTYVSIIGNIINITLDYVLIFGVKDIIPSFGIIGAYIAGAIGLLVPIIILFYLFLSSKNRTQFGTNKWQLNLKLMQECIKVGTPEAIGIGTEILCWGIFYNMMATISQTHIVVTSIAQSITLLFFFFGLGLEHGIAIIAGNLIGANRKNEVTEVWYAGCVLVIIATIMILTVFTNWPNFIVDWFFYNQSHLENIPNNRDTAILQTSLTLVKQCLPIIALYIGIEALRWTFCGLLRAAGDTCFLLYMGIINIIAFMIMPAYVLMVMYHMPIQWFFYIWLFFSIISSIINYIRFNQGHWKNIEIME